MNEKITLFLTLIWPIIPIFWIIVHGFPKLINKIKYFVYFIAFIIFVSISFCLYANKDVLFLFKISLIDSLAITGYLFFSSGLILHIWTLLLLSFPGIIGIPEIKKDKSFNLMTKGPFSIIRHPTYLAHTLIFFGSFLFTGYLVLLIISILDFLVVNFIIIPLEEKELTKRIGVKYIQYKKNVRWKLIPFII
ncbi:MAG: isoprenylcysteine carboxylmethyltransferase family protein [candidate division WOR-3 bacterium]